MRTKKLEKKHREGYLKHPVKNGEFDVWEDEQHKIDDPYHKHNYEIFLLNFIHRMQKL